MQCCGKTATNMILREKSPLTNVIFHPFCAKSQATNLAMGVESSYPVFGLCVVLSSASVSAWNVFGTIGGNPDAWCTEAVAQMKCSGGSGTCIQIGGDDVDGNEFPLLPSMRYVNLCPTSPIDGFQQMFTSSIPSSIPTVRIPTSPSVN